MERAPLRSASSPEPSGLDRVSAALEHDIVPRLLASHRAGPFPPGMLLAAAALVPETEDETAADLGAARVVELVRRLIAPDESGVEG